MSWRVHGRHLLKTIHIAFAGVWLGGLICIIALLIVARAGFGGRDPYPLYYAVYTVHDAVLYVAFAGTLTTGLVFSLFTRWGFAKHRWIAAKWLLAATLFALTLIWQAPAVAGTVALADAGPWFSGYHELGAYADRALWLACAQAGVVAVIFPISTWKPWGRWQRTFNVNKTWLRVGVGALVALGVMFGGFNYVRLQRYRTMVIRPVTFAQVADGRYEGSATCDFVYRVAVEVKSGAVVVIRPLRNRDSHYARFAEGVLTRIVQQQRVPVDAITAATTTSRCLMKAVANALPPHLR